MSNENLWLLYITDLFMVVTMMFGSFVAGATSEGGGAVAFPVMTLGFDIKPYVARDFSLMIQSVGMTSASILIILNRIPVEWKAVLYAGLGGIVGIIFGIEVVSTLLPTSFTKIFFVSLWLSFAFALYWINRDRKREIFSEIQQFDYRTALALFLVGVIGGIVSGITGSGLDIVTFACLVLLFGINEKIATPTSVVLMAINSLTGFFWKGTFGEGMHPQAWEYWYVCVPVVVIGAPLGARFIASKSREFVVGFLYLTIAVQFFAALIIVPQSMKLIWFNIAIILAGSLFFWLMVLVGRERARKVASIS